MPVMDGIDATRAIRSIRELCQMLIIAFSAHGGGDENRRGARATGARRLASDW